MHAYKYRLVFFVFGAWILPASIAAADINAGLVSYWMLDVDVSGVNPVAIGLYDNPDAGGATGTLYIDDIRVIKVPQ